MAKKKSTLLPLADAWRLSCPEYRKRVRKSVIDNKGYVNLPSTHRPKLSGTTVHMIPAVRDKIIDGFLDDVDAPRRNAQKSRKRGVKTLEAVKKVLQDHKDAGPFEQYKRYEALAGFDPVGYRRFKEVRLEILKQSK